eukprot:g823.t1
MLEGGWAKGFLKGYNAETTNAVILCDSGKVLKVKLTEITYQLLDFYDRPCSRVYYANSKSGSSHKDAPGTPTQNYGTVDHTEKPLSTKKQRRRSYTSDDFSDEEDASLRSVKWFYLDAQKRKRGPVSTAALRELLRSEYLTIESYVWNTNMCTWKRAFQVAPLLRGYCHARATSASSAGGTGKKKSGSSRSRRTSFYDSNMANKQRARAQSMAREERERARLRRTRAAKEASQSSQTNAETKTAWTKSKSSSHVRCAPPAARKTKWFFIDFERQQRGPVMEDVLLGFFEKDQITSKTYVWHKGLTKWLPLYKVPALYARFCRAKKERKFTTKDTKTKTSSSKKYDSKAARPSPVTTERWSPSKSTTTAATAAAFRKSPSPRKTSTTKKESKTSTSTSPSSSTYSYLYSSMRTKVLSTPIAKAVAAAADAAAEKKRAMSATAQKYTQKTHTTGISSMDSSTQKKDRSLPLNSIASKIKGTKWYYVDRKGRQRGPLSKGIISGLLKAGCIGAKTYTWCRGMDGWKYISTLGNYFDDNETSTETETAEKGQSSSSTKDGTKKKKFSSATPVSTRKATTMSSSAAAVRLLSKSKVPSASPLRTPATTSSTRKMGTGDLSAGGGGTGCTGASSSSFSSNMQNAGTGAAEEIAPTPTKISLEAAFQEAAAEAGLNSEKTTESSGKRDHSASSPGMKKDAKKVKEKGDDSVADGTKVFSKWYYLDDQRMRRGPVTERALLQLLSTGELTTRTYIWRGGMSQWTRVCNTPADVLSLPETQRSVEKWFYLGSGGKQFGPVSRTSLMTNISVTSSTLVWKKGMHNWLPMNKVAILQAKKEHSFNESSKKSKNNGSGIKMKMPPGTTRRSTPETSHQSQDFSPVHGSYGLADTKIKIKSRLNFGARYANFARKQATSTATVR